MFRVACLKPVMRTAVLSTVLACALQAAAVRAADYPAKPVRLVVPNGAGSSDDFHARLMAQKLGEMLGHPIVVDNRPGAGGVIAQSVVVNAAPDGHTILLTGRSITAARTLNASLPFDPQRALVPIASIARYSFVLVVPPSFRPRSVQEYIAYAREHPGQVRNGDSGRGLIPYLAAVLFRGMTGIEFQQVSYKDFAQIMADLLSARIDSYFAPIQPVLPHMADGRLRALGVTGEARSPVLPGVPTIAESGVPGYEAASWLFFAAPAGTPSPILETLNGASGRVLSIPEVRTALEKVGSEPLVSTTEELAKRVNEATERFARTARSLGIQPQ